jgi:UPF0755 protein
MKWIRIIVVLVLLVLAAWVGYQGWLMLRQHKHQLEGDNAFIYIPSGSRLTDFFTMIAEHPLYVDMEVFQKTANVLNFREKNLRPGKYKIPERFSYFSLIQTLKNGEQTPVNVVLNNERTLEELAEKVARYLEPDAIAFQNFFYQVNTIDSVQINPERVMCYIIPNTYQFFWNTDPDAFMGRMIKEHKKFWEKEGRKAKADSLGLSSEEVYTLASIVEKETQAKSERPRVAGLYLNRLREGMKLQADPTVVFALGDFTIKRILFHHLNTDSPYNTYLYEGLPPGPICMASINSIDAVLNAEQHDYVYMCAKPGLSGEHVFADSYKEHLKNAAVYRQWLDRYLREKENGE